MHVPNVFAVAEALKHRSPEYVRGIAGRYGFRCRTAQGTKESEIWTKPDGSGGHWIIRLDTMGHATRFHFGARPHYHKNWVESNELLQEYLSKYTPEAWVFSDAGLLIGRAGGGNQGGRSDRKAKEQHVPR